MPVALNYSGAVNTHRLSGGQSWNQQNLPHNDKDTGRGLRTAIIAPPGHQIVAADSSGIELRTNMWICRQTDKMQAIREGRDLYKDFSARMLYHIAVEAINSEQRQTGKVAVLSCGYGTGKHTFRNMLFTQTGRIISIEAAEMIVNMYRKDNAQVKKMWYMLDDMLKRMIDAVGVIPNFTGGPFEFRRNTVVLPSGLKLKYPTLRLDQHEQLKFTKRYNNPSGVINIWGGVLLENLNQAIAREIITDMAQRIFKASAMRMALQVHDELVYVVPDAHVDAFKRLVRSEMSTPPSWWPDLHVGVEVGSGDNYGLIKKTKA
jgi:DNA polymerase I-like protein with 3'-5' exonuclease and polymerase domains